MTVVMSRRIRLVAKGGDGRYVFVTDEDDWYQITQDELEQMCADVADLNKRAALSRPPSEYGMSDEPACPKCGGNGQRAKCPAAWHRAPYSGSPGLHVCPMCEEGWTHDTTSGRQQSDDNG